MPGNPRPRPLLATGLLAAGLAACAPAASPPVPLLASAAASPALAPAPDAGAVAGTDTGADTGLAAAAAREIGFGTVADAHAALLARGGIRHFVRGTYEVFIDDPGHAVWLFTRPGSAAYPALVRRQLVPSRQGTMMKSAVFCEAEQSVCALLQENTRLMDAAIVGNMDRGDDTLVPHPARPPASAGVRL